MSHPHRTAARTGAALRSAGLGALGVTSAALGLAGLLAGEGVLTRARIPKGLPAPPVLDGTTWRAPGVGAHGVPLRLAPLGDSLAAGLGSADAAGTLGGRLALALSAAAERPVRLSCTAEVGARSATLRGQVTAVGAAGRPDLAVVIIGANDVMHRCAGSDALHRLELAVHGLELLGSAVVVGTCPDLGAVTALAEPLRHLAGRQARLYATAQAGVVRRAGGHPVDLIATVGPRFRADPALFAADGYHPSAAGYAAAAEALVPVARAALGRSGDGAVRAA